MTVLSLDGITYPPPNTSDGVLTNSSHFKPERDVCVENGRNLASWGRWPERETRGVAMGV